MFNVGDRVICINNFRFMEDPKSGSQVGLIVGAKYTVNKIDDFGVRFVDNEFGFFIKERFKLDISYIRKEKLLFLNEKMSNKDM